MDSKTHRILVISKIILAIQTICSVAWFPVIMLNVEVFFASIRSNYIEIEWLNQWSKWLTIAMVICFVAILLIRIFYRDVPPIKRLLRYSLGEFGILILLIASLSHYLLGPASLFASLLPCAVWLVIWLLKNKKFDIWPKAFLILEILASLAFLFVIASWVDESLAYTFDCNQQSLFALNDRPLEISNCNYQYHGPGRDVLIEIFRTCLTNDFVLYFSERMVIVLASTGGLLAALLLNISSGFLLLKNGKTNQFMKTLGLALLILLVTLLFIPVTFFSSTTFGIWLFDNPTVFGR